MCRNLLTLILLLFAPLSMGAKEYTPADVPNVQLQDRHCFVSDPEGYFTTEERTALDQALSDLRERYTVEVALVVLPGIEGDDPERFTVKLFELWGIGREEDDNGLLILYKYGSKGNRIIRFETGYGLEGVLPDITTKRLTNHYLLPAIEEGRDAEGFLQLFGAIDQLLAEGYEPVASGDVIAIYETEQEEAFWQMIKGYLAVACLIGLLFAVGIWSQWRKKEEPAEQLNLLQRNFSMPRQLWQWLIFPALLFLLPLYLILRLRSSRQIKDCPKCHAKGSVRQIASPDNLPLLTAPQAVEQRIQSINYTVYDCASCDYHRTIGLSNPLSPYKRCPRCGTKSYSLVTQEEHRRYILNVYRCEYCRHTESTKVKISDTGSVVGPIIGTGGFGGGFSGGGFGGGFGGGLSGGGGSTTRF